MGPVLDLLPATFLFAPLGLIGPANGVSPVDMLGQRIHAVRGPARLGFERATQPVDSGEVHAPETLQAVLMALALGLGGGMGAFLPVRAPVGAGPHDPARPDVVPRGPQVLLQRLNLALGGAGLAADPREHAAGPAGLRGLQGGPQRPLPILGFLRSLTGLGGPPAGVGEARRRLDRGEGLRHPGASVLGPPVELAQRVGISRAGLRRDPGRSGPKIAGAGPAVGARYLDRRCSSAASRASIRRSISVW